MVKPKEPGDLKRPKLYTRDTCPDRDKYHFDLPVGVVQRVEAIVLLLPTHVQSQCPTCHLWVVWTLRAADEGDEPE